MSASQLLILGLANRLCFSQSHELERSAAERACPADVPVGHKATMIAKRKAILRSMSSEVAIPDSSRR